MNDSPRCIDAAALGVALGPVSRTLSKRSLMSYAAALGATEDVYLDDLRAGGIVGCPPFMVVPEWEIMNGPAYRQALGMDDAGMWSCIHVQQDSRFFAPLTPGMTLRTRGDICEIRNTRIGCYVSVRLTSSVGEQDTPVAESWFCGIFLRHFSNGENACIASAPALPRRERTGPAAPALPLMTVERGLAHLYTEAASIWNPIHTERSEAKAVGLDDTLLHGTYTWARAGLFLIRRFAAGEPTRLRRLGGRMAGKALTGSRLAIRCEASAEPEHAGTVYFEVVDADGTVILADGIAEFTGL